MQNNVPMDKGLNLSSSWAEFNRGRAITLPVQDTVPLVPGLTAETLDDVDMIAEQGIRVEWTRADNATPETLTPLTMAPTRPTIGSTNPRTV